MELLSSKHAQALQLDYRNVGDKTWIGKDFDDESINISRNLFTAQSLKNRCPDPKPLEVYALLTGIEFPYSITSKLKKIQNDLSKILDDSLCYFVSPKNLGLEFAVFKWPDDPWVEAWEGEVLNYLEQIHLSPFTYILQGIQINPDGCIVARGYDNGELSTVRKNLKESISFLPSKQSNWAHIPLGRILEPVGTKKFNLLKSFINNNQDKFITSYNVSSAKFVHETQWYMEQKKVISEIKFD